MNAFGFVVEFCFMLFDVVFFSLAVIFRTQIPMKKRKEAV